MKTKDKFVNGSFKINIHLWILLNIAVCAIINDYIIYVGNTIPYGIGLAISSILCIGGNIALIKKKIISIASDFEWYDLFFIGIVVIMAISTIFIPDFSYDTANYHIYLQENIRMDKVNFDFFAGKTINGFLFALGDRMHYICRFLLGYRIGTILSYYSLIVIFYQTKNIINHICGYKKIHSILSIICLSSYIIRQWLGTYYIDIFSVAFTISLISFLIKEKECFQEKKKLLFISLLTGILTAIKLPNILLVAPVLLIFVIKKRKQIHIKNIPIYAICAGIFLVPFILYIIDSFIQTGSPLFPYYNNIFKSEYFGDYSWVEPLFGIPNWKYKLMWPIYTSLSKDGYGDGFLIRDPIWAIGYVVTLVYFIFSTIRWKKRNTKLYLVSIIALIMTAIWIEFMYGYMRYALIIPVLYSILIASIASKILQKLKQKFLNTYGNLKLLKISLIILAISLMSIFILYNVIKMRVNKTYDNLRLAFKDRDNVSIHIDGVWGVIGDDSALTQLLREDGVPIYNLHSGLFNGSDKALEQYNKILNNNQDIYFLWEKENCYRKDTYLSINGFDFIEVKQFTSDDIPFIRKNHILYLYKIVK